MRRLITIILLLSCAVTYGQTPKRELRAAWIATLFNLDWPSKGGLPAVQQQNEFRARLDELKSVGCNAVIVQVRPAADALYPSTLEPWSRFLTGKQGQPPFPYYDPLKFMVEEAHKRNMEFHAWFNPFRALTDSRRNPNPKEHVTKEHPDWLVNYGTKTQLDPGKPEAREYIIRVITDVVKRYDIDAVHLDDYFYPYYEAGKVFNDQTSYKKYSHNGQNLEDWRRENVSLFISVLNTNIKSIKPYMKLGISPFGVWRNSDKDPRGSKTRGGQTCYDNTCADVLLWLQKGWIDYCMPQLYWEHGHRLAPFDILLPWWEAQKHNRHVYYGLGMYKMHNTKSTAWKGTKEILWQINDIRTQSEHAGYSLYRAAFLNMLGDPFLDSLKEYNKHVAFPPRMPWLGDTPPPSPVLDATPSYQGTLLRWNLDKRKTDAVRYAVYRFTDGEQVDFNNSENIIAVLYGSTEYLDVNANKYKESKYYVTALDRLWNESPPSNETITTTE